MEIIVKTFLDKPSEENGYNLIANLRQSKCCNTAVLIGTFISKIYKHSIHILAETAACAYFSNQYKLAYDLYTKCISFPQLNDEIINIMKSNRHLAIKHISDMYIHYPKKIIESICNKPENLLPLVTFTITSCKRFDLFEKTMNSFLNCCKDVDRIDEWLCVDDNSSDEDRSKMKKLYPFFTFVFKSLEDKGHPQSMNIIQKHVKTDYVFHMEDDWKYFSKRNYITECLAVINSKKEIGQCLINKNYAETAEDFNIVGGVMSFTPNGIRYYIHEYTKTNEDKQNFFNKYKNSKNCAYWPHFSFRPSLVKTDIFKQLGQYNEKVSHFEMDYSYKYCEAGFISTFLDGIHCLHTGRLTSQRNDKSILNAYDLNNEAQFSGKEDCTNTVVPKRLKPVLVNMDNRPDRLSSIEKISPIKYERFSAVNGKSLTPTVQLQQIFENNDYNMRSGMVGCALSHVKIYIELLKSDCDSYCVLEDDITFVPEFTKKLVHLFTLLNNKKWDLVYLGHHLYPNQKTIEKYDKSEMPSLDKMSTSLSLMKSMGGTFGYLVSKSGAEKLLEFINKHGMTNGIDTVQQKAISVMDTYYCSPHLVYSECYDARGKQMDTDIQHDYSSLTISMDKRLSMEEEFYQTVEKFTSETDLLSFYENSNNVNKVVLYSGEYTENVKLYIENNVKLWYFVGKTLVIVPNPTDEQLNGRYKDRLKKNGEWNIDDVFTN